MHTSRGLVLASWANDPPPKDAVSFKRNTHRKVGWSARTRGRSKGYVEGGFVKNRARFWLLTFHFVTPLGFNKASNNVLQYIAASQKLGVTLSRGRQRKLTV